MRETATEADHESDDARREGAREWRWGSVAVAGWGEAMAGSVGGGRIGEAAERKGTGGVGDFAGGRLIQYAGRLARFLAGRCLVCELR